MTTEAEAKTKWCPMVRTQRHSVSTPQYGSQRALESQRQDGGFTCMGSACMMWRWDLVGQHGHCGLAGGV